MRTDSDFILLHICDVTKKVSKAKEVSAHSHFFKIQCFLEVVCERRVGSTYILLKTPYTWRRKFAK